MTTKVTIANEINIKDNEVIIIVGSDKLVFQTPDKKQNEPEHMVLVAGNPEMMGLFTKISKNIEDGGYLDVNGIVRRWIPSQCLNMEYSLQGFHQSLLSMGAEYSWKVLVNDLKRQAKMWKSNDAEGYRDRNRWYNRSVAKDMARDYQHKVESRILYLVKNQSNHKCKGLPYIPFKCWLNNGKGVFVKEIKDVTSQFMNLCNNIECAANPVTLYNAVNEFYSYVKKVKDTWVDDHAVSKVFTNAYKAAGGYYTMKDLILFEGCVIYGTDSKGREQKFDIEDSLTLLDEIAENFIHGDGGVQYNGYRMLGVMRKFLKDNNFQFNETKAKWQRQSEMRKAARRMSERRINK